MISRTAVFLDRDGILDRLEARDGRPCAPRRLRDVRLTPGVTRGVSALHEAGFLTVVVTNQPDIANGHVDSLETVRMFRRDAAIAGYAISGAPAIPSGAAAR